jgi:hypothetical protein
MKTLATRKRYDRSNPLTSHKLELDKLKRQDDKHYYFQIRGKQLKSSYRKVEKYTPDKPVALSPIALYHKKKLAKLNK